MMSWSYKDSVFMIQRYKLLDIEDTKLLWAENNMWGYYYQMERVEKADIILAPYNYLLQNGPKSTLVNRLSNNSKVVILIDEAHNIPNMCEDTGTFELTIHSLLNMQN